MDRTLQSGFTLIELLAAISILAIVAVLGWRGLDTLIRTRVTLTADLEQTRGMQLAFAQMQSDCEHITKSNEIGQRPTLLVEQGRLTLVRGVYTDNQPSRVQVVSYRIRNGFLSRRESEATRDLRILDDLWRAASSDAAEVSGATPAVTLQSDVTSMNIRLWTDSGGWLATGENAPPGSASNSATAAPTGLEVTLRLGGREYGMVKVMLLGAI